MSDNGPQTSWHTPMAMKNVIRLNCTAASLVPRLAPIEGRAGRYMSMAKGPIAVSKPRTTAFEGI